MTLVLHGRSKRSLKRRSTPSPIRRDALGWLAAAAEKGLTFDLVFVDPPYSSAGRVAARLSERLPAVLTDSSLTVTESDKRAPLAIDLPRVDERVYGDTLIAFHRGR